MQWWNSWMFCFHSSSGSVLQPRNWRRWSSGRHCHELFDPFFMNQVTYRPRDLSCAIFGFIFHFYRWFHSNETTECKFVSSFHIAGLSILSLRCNLSLPLLSLGCITSHGIICSPNVTDFLWSTYVSVCVHWGCLLRCTKSTMYEVGTRIPQGKGQ